MVDENKALVAKQLGYMKEADGGRIEILRRHPSDVEVARVLAIGNRMGMLAAEAREQLYPDVRGRLSDAKLEKVLVRACEMWDEGNWTDSISLISEDFKEN